MVAPVGQATEGSFRERAGDVGRIIFPDIPLWGAVLNYGFVGVTSTFIICAQLGKCTVGYDGAIVGQPEPARFRATEIEGGAIPVDPAKVATEFDIPGAVGARHRVRICDHQAWPALGFGALGLQ